MFGLFTPKCPIEITVKTWVERRMLWFVERFGISRIRNARVILPTDEFFPDQYDADYPSVRRCLDRICGYMGVEPKAITLHILPDEAMPNAAGWYEMRAQSNICVAASQLEEPTRLMATLAHELAHEILLRGQHLTSNEIDHEQTTDLLPAFLGIGIFGANATIKDVAHNYGHLGWWSIFTQGYLSSFIHGYALALFAFVRGEQWPYWRKYLRPDARGTFEKGLRFLQKTRDSLFTPETVGLPQSLPTVASVLDLLSHRSPTYCIAGLWDMVVHSINDPKLLEAVVSCLSHGDANVRTEAAWAVSVFGDAAHAAVPQLVKLLEIRDPGHVAAVNALGRLRAEPKTVMPELIDLLRAPIKDVSWETIEALRAYGPDAAAALPRLLEHFEMAVGNNDHLTTPIARALLAISPDPQRELREHMGERDPDVLRFALKELATIPTDPADPRCARADMGRDSISTRSPVTW